MQYIATSIIISDIYLVQRGSGEAMLVNFSNPFDDKLNLFSRASEQVLCKTFSATNKIQYNSLFNDCSLYTYIYNNKYKNMIITRLYTADVVWYRHPLGQPT